MKTYTLRPDVSLSKIYIYRKPVDFRKGHRGLGAIIEQELAHDPFSGTLYVFINRQGNKLIERNVIKKSTMKTSQEIVFGITSKSADKASAEQVLQDNRKHWAVESCHYTFHFQESPV